MANAHRQTFDAEKFSVNTAWLKKGGQHFEVVVEPDNALEFRRTKGASPELKECLHAERIFSDAKRGLHAKDADLEVIFGSTDPLEVARILLLEGELQLTAEHRATMRETKRHAILAHIKMYAIDPRTGLPHPQQRIELAMDEVNVRIDDQHPLEEQVTRIIRELQPVLPIRLETVTIQVHLPAPFGQKLYGDLARFGKLRKSDWMPDGALLAWVEMPAGLQTDLFDEMGKRTHGAAEMRRVEERRLDS